MRASALSTADDTRPKEQAFPRRLFVSFGRLSDGQPGKCTESSSGQPGHFTERPSVRREPALLAGRRKVTSLPKPGPHPTGGTHPPPPGGPPPTRPRPPPPPGDPPAGGGPGDPPGRRKRAG